MNRVRKVKRNGATLANYSYLADGTKVSVLDSLGNGLLYLGSMVFNKTSDGTQLESISWDGGRIVAEPDGWGGTNMVPYLYSPDHLGSVRAVRNALTGAVVSRSDYEPYGAHTTLSGNPQRYRYNGKEDQSFAGTPYLDYGARQYDPAIGRWMVPDPLAEKYYSVSPYTYCIGNPINRIDFYGTEVTDYYSLKGRLLRHIDDGSEAKYFVLLDDVDLAINSNAVFPVPSQDVMRSMEQAYSRTEETGKESGFQVDENGVPGLIGEGDECSIDIPYVYLETGAYAAYDVHTHPRPVIVPGYNRWSDEPSETDIANNHSNYPSVVLGYNNVQEGAIPKRSLVFYNGQGIIGKSINYEHFKKVVKNVNQATR